MSEELKVVQVLYSGLGGHGSVVFSLLEADKEYARSNRLIFYGIEPLLKEYEEKCKSIGIPYTYIQVKSGKPFKGWRSVLRSLKQSEPCCIILHSLTLVFPIMFLSKNSRAKLIVVEHTPFIVKTAFDKICSKLAMYIADRIVVLTEQYYKQYKKSLGSLFKKEKVCIIPNGINTDLFTPIQKEETGTIVIGMAGRFTHQKKFKTLLQVVAEVKKTFPAICLKLAGTGDTLADVKAYGKELEIEDAIVYEGHLTEQQMVQFYQSLDFYVHISDGEAMSTSVIQAMGCGIPVIASDISGINNVVQHNITGLLCPNSVEAFKDAILYLIANKPISMGFSKNSRKIALEKLNNTEMLAKYRRLID